MITAAMFFHDNCYPTVHKLLTNGQDTVGALHKHVHPVLQKDFLLTYELVCFVLHSE